MSIFIATTTRINNVKKNSDDKFSNILNELEKNRNAEITNAAVQKNETIVVD